MARWVNQDCKECGQEYGTTEEAERRNLFLKDKYRVCGNCQTKAKRARIDAHKAKVNKYPKELQMAAHQAAIVKLLMKTHGEETYWATVAGQIEE